MQLIAIQTYLLAQQQSGALNWDEGLCAWWHKSHNTENYDVYIALTDDGFEFQVYDGVEYLTRQPIAKLSQLKSLLETNWTEDLEMAA